MAERIELRAESKKRYKDRKNIERKWLSQYGSMSLDGDYQRNRSCIFEVFNMLDVVMENIIDDYRKSHVIVRIEPDGHSAYYTFEHDNGQTIRFRKPTSFASRVIALRAIGYELSDELFYGTRLLRNETTHGNKTIILQYMQLSYTDTKRAMLSMADALISLGQLSQSLREPDFEMLRVQPGSTLHNDEYVIKKLIGEGGMSRVYLADQKRIGREFAIKELKAGTFSEAQVRHEREVLSALDHKQIPQIYDVFSENSTCYIVMNYIDGSSLKEFINEKGPNGSAELTDDIRQTICVELMDILEYLHDSNFAFVDLSPDNIMIDHDNHPHLIDFGITTALDTRQERPAATIGYSAPEAFAGGVLDQRSDIYSLGYVLRFLYSGLSPQEDPQKPTSELISDTKMAEAVNICTAQNPEKRFSSIAELRNFLYPGSPNVHTKKKNKYVLAGVIGVAVFAIIIAALSAIFKNRSAAEDASAASSDVPDKSYLELLYEEPSIPFDESGLEDHVMNWNDDKLEAVMRNITGINKGDILLSDIWDIQILDMEYQEIHDISALAELTQLKELYVGHNNISDLSALASLTSLTHLEFEYNPLTDTPDCISFLNNLPHIIWLDMNHCGVIDISALSSLTELKDTDLSGNEISDLSPLKDLTNLEYLDISGNQISDLSPLSGLSKVNYLNISSNNISGDLDALSAMTEMSRLYLSSNHITDISALRNMKQLIDLDISGNEITDLSVLDELQVETVRK